VEPTWQSDDGRVRLFHADADDVLPFLAGHSIDSCITDPPYGLSFMGRRWDSHVPQAAHWLRVMECLKPGSHLLSFFGTRTYHRGASQIEDAGFEIRDQLAWVYGSGFPKSLDVSKAIDKAAGAEREVVATGKAVKRMIPGADQDRTGSWIKDNGREFVPTETLPATEAARQWNGWGTALKPAWEPIVMARVPFDTTVADNVQAYGTGAINVDGCRVASGPRPQITSTNSLPSNGKYGEGLNGSIRDGETTLGRFPANLIHDGGPDVLSVFPDAPGAFADVKGTEPSVKQSRVYGAMGRDGIMREAREDSGSAARFFYCAKASADDREAGNTHETVKPTALMEWLCRLVTREGGVVLDPMMGSGSTGKAALRAGFQFVGIERDQKSFDTAVDRVKRAWLDGKSKLFSA
jgi:DNA modification methylase